MGGFFILQNPPISDPSRGFNQGATQIFTHRPPASRPTKDKVPLRQFLTLRRPGQGWLEIWFTSDAGKKVTEHVVYCPYISDANDFPMNPGA